MNLKVSFQTLLWPFCRKIQHRRLSLLMPELLNCGRLRLEESCFASYVAKCMGQEIASEIVKSVHLLQAIQWGKQAWNEIDSETIRKCFAKVGMYPEKLSDDDDDDPFEGEEMMNLKELCSKLSNDCSAEQYLDADDYVPFCDNLINIED